MTIATFYVTENKTILVSKTSTLLRIRTM